MFHHYKELQTLLYGGEKVWHKWNILQLENYLTHRTMAVLGPSSSGKTNSAATDVLTDYFVYPNCTTVLICSTTKERLQDRIFGEIKKYHKIARENYPQLPGHMIEGRLRIVTDSRNELSEGRDFRNGVIGVACLAGGNFRGISEFIGIKNERVRVVIDEIQMLPPAILLSLSNLDKNTNFKAIGLGNPKETTDALGEFAEPSEARGGWDGGVDQIPETKTWETRRPGGVTVQLVGTDSPNLDGKLGIPLITQEAIDRDVAQYGKDSLQFSMMNMGMMPRGQGSRRVITRQLCLKNHAMEEPNWLDSNRTSFASLDAAYRGVGGDRCVFMHFEMGYESDFASPSTASFVPNLMSQEPPVTRKRQIIAILSFHIVPINIKLEIEAEEQIVNWVKTYCLKHGIDPERFFFESGMRTSLVSCFARLWSPATNPIDSGGQPTERPVSYQIEQTCREYYSKFITEQWFSTRLIIEAGQMRGMTDALINEGCMREWKISGKNKTEVESKEAMKEKSGRSPDLYDCVVEGTLVATLRGFIPVEQIEIGDMALTPFGYFPVVLKHEQLVGEITTVTFPNGNTLSGKANHRVFAKGDGWIKMGDLSVDNDIESMDNLPIWNLLNSLFTREEGIGFKQQADIIKMRIGTVSPKDFYTGLSGKSTMVIFLLAIASITRMVSGGIMTSGIWSWLKSASTLAIISKSVGAILSHARCSWKAFLTGLKKPPFGMELMMDSSGTATTLKGCGLIRSRGILFALIAEIHSPPPASRRPSSAPSAANKNSLESGIRTTIELARCAARILWLTATRKRHIAPITVRQSQLLELKKVYDLSVSGPNVYYANGFLVENCFAIGCEGARRLGFEIDNKLAKMPKASRATDWHKKLKDEAKAQWSEGVLDY